MEIGFSGRIAEVLGCGAIWLVCCWGAFCTTVEALATEVRLRAECCAGASVVRLGDVADILSVDPQEAAALEQLELFAAPPAGRVRHVTAREIHEALVLAGCDLRKVRLMGAARICISAAERQPMERRVALSPGASLHRGKKLIEQAVRGALETPYGVGRWGLEWDGGSSAFAAAARPGAVVNVLQVTPLDAPQSGEDYVALSSTSPAAAAENQANSGLHQEGDHPPRRQAHQPNASRKSEVRQSREFDVQLRITIGEEESTHTLHVRAARQPQVVVARRMLAPGTIITSADIDLTEAGPMYSSHPPAPDGSSTAERVERGSGRGAPVQAARVTWDECVGMEATRTIAAGQVLTADALRQPTLVKRGEAVTVYARSRGVMVRVTGRALESGSRGSVIPIESLENRQRFLARVSGLQQVVVEVEPQHADSDMANPNGLAGEPYLGGDEAVSPTSALPEASQAPGNADRPLHRPDPVPQFIAQENGL